MIYILVSQPRERNIIIILFNQGRLSDLLDTVDRRRDLDLMPAPYPRTLLTHRLENILLADQKIFHFLSGGLDRLSILLRLDLSVRFLIYFICGGKVFTSTN